MLKPTKKILNISRTPGNNVLIKTFGYIGPDTDGYCPAQTSMNRKDFSFKLFTLLHSIGSQKAGKIRETKNSTEAETKPWVVM